MKPKRLQRIDYNAPFTLTYTIIAACVYAISILTGGWLQENLFSTTGNPDWANVITYPRLFVHVLGHGSFDHLLFNMTILLLIGPMLEKMYGAKMLLTIALITALLTALIMAFFFSGHLLGASGVVFSLIVLSSFANAKSGTIPLTFVFVVIIFLGNEIYSALTVKDNIAQFAHITGGFVGGVFGLFLASRADSAWR